MLFPALQATMSPWLGDSVFLRRLTNLAPLIYFAACTLYIWRRVPAARAFALVFFVLVLTSKKALTLFPEFRSYFWLLCASASLAALMYATFLQQRDLDGRQDRTMAAFLAVTIVLSLNLHYLSDVIVGFFLLTCSIAHAMVRRWRWAALIVISTIVGIAPLLVMVTSQLPYMAVVTQAFWIHTTPFDALKMLVAVVAHTLGDNVVFGILLAATAASLGLALLGRQSPVRTLAESPPPGAWRFVAAAVAAAVLAGLLLLAASFAKPILEPRYLTAMVALAGSAAAALVANHIAAQRGLTVLFCGMGLLVAGYHAKKPLHDPRWEATASYLQANVARCPSSVVYALDPRFSQPYNHPVNQAEIQDWGYGLVARAHGFTVRTIDARNAIPPRLSQGCPTYLWAEHTNIKRLPMVQNAAFAGSPGMRARMQAATVFKGRSGFVIVLPPARDAAVRGSSG
jgi:hypothetical protein